MKSRILAGAVFFSLVLSLQVMAQENRYGIFDTLSLKNFHPESRLQVPAHEILRPKFPVIDAHS
ncbi:MAG TPA: hypothetical protein VM123_19490, partial [archaeon]|nr:hypothetical protein [archaeon]